MASQLFAPARQVIWRCQEVWRPRNLSRLLPLRRCSEPACQDTDTEAFSARRTLEAVPSQANVVECHDDPEQSLSLPPHALCNISARLQTYFVILALVSGWNACHAPPSLALTHGWRPRRHHRRLGEKDRVVHQQTVRDGYTYLLSPLEFWASYSIEFAIVLNTLPHFLICLGNTCPLFFSSDSKSSLIRRP